MKVILLKHVIKFLTVCDMLREAFISYKSLNFFFFIEVKTINLFSSETKEKCNTLATTADKEKGRERKRKCKFNELNKYTS